MWYLFEMDKQEKFIGLGHPFEKFMITDGEIIYDVTGRLDNTMVTRGQGNLVSILLVDREFNSLNKSNLKLISELNGRENEIYFLKYADERV